MTNVAAAHAEPPYKRATTMRFCLPGGSRASAARKTSRWSRTPDRPLMGWTARRVAVLQVLFRRPSIGKARCQPCDSTGGEHLFGSCGIPWCGGVTTASRTCPVAAMPCCPVAASSITWCDSVPDGGAHVAAVRHDSRLPNTFRTGAPELDDLRATPPRGLTSCARASMPYGPSEAVGNRRTHALECRDAPSDTPRRPTLCLSVGRARPAPLWFAGRAGHRLGYLVLRGTAVTPLIDSSFRSLGTRCSGPISCLADELHQPHEGATGNSDQGASNEQMQLLPGYGCQTVRLQSIFRYRRRSRINGARPRQRSGIRQLGVGKRVLEFGRVLTEVDGKRRAQRHHTGRQAVDRKRKEPVSDPWQVVEHFRS